MHVAAYTNGTCSAFLPRAENSTCSAQKCFTIKFLVSLNFQISMFARIVAVEDIVQAVRTTNNLDNKLVRSPHWNGVSADLSSKVRHISTLLIE